MITGIGLFVSFAAPAILIYKTEGVLWSEFNDRYGYSPYAFFLPFCLAAAALLGGLSAAHVANAYPDWLVRLKTGKRSTFITWPSLRYPVAHMMMALVRQAVTKWILLLGALTGILARAMGSNDVIEGCILGAVLSVVVVLLISLGNAALIVFLKSTIFSEDVLSLTPQQRRWILTMSAFVFTGLTSFWALIFVPLCAVLAALYVYRAIPLLDEDFDKAKRKEKNLLAVPDKSDGETSLNPYTTEKSDATPIRR